MKKYLIITLFLLPPLLFAEDIITFKNGDVLKGTIINTSDSRVYLNTKSVGPISLERENIKSISQKSKEVQQAKKTENREIKKLAKPPSKAQAKIKTNLEAPKVKSKEKNFYDLFITPFYSEGKGKFSGKVALSLSMQDTTKEKNSGTEKNFLELYKLKGNLKWIYGANNFRWNTEYLHKESDLKKYEDSYKVTQRYQNNLTKTYYATAETTYRRDFGRNIESEFLQSAELGIHWIRSKNYELKTSAGGAYHEFEKIEGKGPSSAGDGKFIFDQSFKWKIVETLRLRQSFSHLGDIRHYYMVFKSSIENKIMKQLSLSMDYKIVRDTGKSYQENNTIYTNKTLYTSLAYSF